MSLVEAMRWFVLVYKFRTAALSACSRLCPEIYGVHRIGTWGYIYTVRINSGNMYSTMSTAAAMVAMSY